MKSQKNENEMSLRSPQKIEEVQKVPDQPEKESDSENYTCADKTVKIEEVVAKEQFVRKRDNKRDEKATNKSQKIFQEENKENKDDGDDQSDELMSTHD